MLVRVTDELGRDWTCYERDPTIDTERQRISQPYEFVSGGETFQETLVHNYLLPEELSRALDDLGLTVDSTAGDFDGLPSTRTRASTSSSWRRSDSSDLSLS